MVSPTIEKPEPGQGLERLGVRYYPRIVPIPHVTTASDSGRWLQSIPLHHCLLEKINQQLQVLWMKEPFASNAGIVLRFFVIILQFIRSSPARFLPSLTPDSESVAFIARHTDACLLFIILAALAAATSRR